MAGAASRDGDNRPIAPCERPQAETLPALLREIAEATPDAQAVRTATDGRSFAEIADRAARVAGALAAQGIGRGSRVGILMGNGIDWIVTTFGAAMAGATVVPFSTWSTRDELAFLLRDSGVAVVFAVPAFGDRDFAEDLTATIDGRDIRVILATGNSVHGFQTLSSFVADAVPAGPADGPGRDDDALILYTSGSTSAPKGVRLTHRGVVSNGFNIGERQGLKPGDRVFLSAPLFWSYGGANALPAAFSHGATLVLAERFDAAGALELIERQRCTAIYTLPAMTGALVRDAGFRREAAASLRTGLTIGSPEDFALAVDDLGVAEICNIYGATETYGNCCVTWHHWSRERRAACQGTPLPDQEMRFRDRETGALLAAGEVGLVEVRGCVSPGYTGASAKLNETAFTEDGFYRTGDVGRLDEGGAFVFVGRDTDMIKRSGINVSPAEVEDVLRMHPDVGQCAVTGVPDAERDELIVAYVVAESGAEPDPGALARHCAERLSKYKLPDHVAICDALPLTTTGKLQRKELKAQATDLMASQRAGTS